MIISNCYLHPHKEKIQRCGITSYFNYKKWFLLLHAEYFIRFVCIAQVSSYNIVFFFTLIHLILEILSVVYGFLWPWITGAAVTEVILKRELLTTEIFVIIIIIDGYIKCLSKITKVDLLKEIHLELIKVENIISKRKMIPLILLLIKTKNYLEVFI